MNNEFYTICRLTPSGIGAIAVIRLEGSGSFAAINSCFRRRSSVKTSRNVPFMAQSVPVSGLVYGQLFDPNNSFDSPEDVILSRVALNAFEINCHGGTAAVDRAIRILSEASENSSIRDGLNWVVRQFTTSDRPASTKYSNQDEKTLGKIALLLTRSKTWKTTAVLLDQYKGAWERQNAEIAALEAEGSYTLAKQKRERIRSFTNLGRHLTQPWRVALTGKPNAGKSSLLNCLLGFDRAIVNETSGTTRDVVSAETILDGWPFELIDTAGICQSDDPLEQEGIERAVQQIKSADLILTLHAADETSESIEQTRNDWFQWRQKSVPCLDIITKSDLEHVSCPPLLYDWLRMSVKNRQGVDSLIRLIVETLIPELPGPDDAVPLDFESLLV